MAMTSPGTPKSTSPSALTASDQRAEVHHEALRRPPEISSDALEAFLEGAGFSGRNSKAAS